MSKKYRPRAFTFPRPSYEPATPHSYYRAGKLNQEYGRRAGVGDRRQYFVSFTDPLLGVLFCTVDEAFSAADIRAQANPKLDLEAIDVGQVPEPVRVKLQQVVRESTLED